MNFFKNIWEAIVKYYMIYSDFVHSIFPDQLGDLVVFMLDLAVLALIIKVVGSFAFTTKSGEN